MRAKLTPKDIEIIENLHPKFLAEEIAQHVSEGIGPKTIQKYIDENLGETQAQADERTAPSKNPDAPEGVVVHREVDSIMSDAIATHRVQEQTEGQKQRNKGFIHVPFDE
jgi:hypothetical protein